MVDIASCFFCPYFSNHHSFQFSLNIFYLLSHPQPHASLPSLLHARIFSFSFIFTTPRLFLFPNPRPSHAPINYSFRIFSLASFPPGPLFPLPDLFTFPLSSLLPNFLPSSIYSFIPSSVIPSFPSLF